MRNKFKIAVLTMLAVLAFSEISQIVNVGSQIVWAQEEQTSTETSKTEVSSTEPLTTTSQDQSSTTQTSSAKEFATSKVATNSEVTNEVKTTSEKKPAAITDFNETQKEHLKKAVNAFQAEIARRQASSSKQLGNYAGASVTESFTIRSDFAPTTTASTNGYTWEYKTKLLAVSASVINNNSPATSFGVTVQPGNGTTTFTHQVKRNYPATYDASAQIRYHFQVEMTETEYFWGKGQVKTLTLNDYYGDPVWVNHTNVAPDGIPSAYNDLYQQWKNNGHNKIADEAVKQIESSSNKLGQNVGDSVTFNINGLVESNSATYNNTSMVGKYSVDPDKFQLSLDSTAAQYIQLEKIGSSGTNITYRMKRIKNGNISRNHSVNVTSQHNTKGETVTIRDGYSFYSALPLKNITSVTTSLPIDLTDKRQIWADPIEQTIELGAGTFLSELPDVSQLITNVRLEDGTPISASEYTAQISWRPTFDNMAITDKIVVKLTRRETGIVTTINVPVKMTWGNTIQLRGENDKTAGAYTLKNVDGSYYIRASYGENKNYQSAIHSQFGDSPYHSITTLKKGSGRIDQLTGDYYNETKANTSTKQFVEGFPYGQRSVQLGSVVKLWHKEQWRNSYFKDEKEIKYSNQNEGITYFAVTANGFVPYRLNQLKAKEMTINMSTTDAELDQKKEDMIDFLGMNGNGLKVSKISQYPDRSKAGTAQGKVLVEETIDGQTYTYEYKVPFKVEDNRQPQADVVEQTVTLGTQADELTVTNMLTNVRLSDGTKLSSDEYTVEIVKIPAFDSMAITEHIRVRLTYKSNNQSIELFVPIKMSWGSTIQLRGEYGNTAGAYTLKKVGDSYYIHASYGENKNYTSVIHSKFGDSPYHSITTLRKGSGRIDQLIGDYYSETKANTTTKQFVEDFPYGQRSVQLGSVVKLWHKEQWHNSYFKDEKEIKYFSTNNEVVYFAVTADGFVPYRLNQLKAKKMTINMSTTDAELDQKKEEMIDFLGLSGNDLKVSKISQYPDRSKAGTSQGRVLVEETIDGQTYTYEYEVPFKVEDDRPPQADVVEQIITLGAQAEDFKETNMITNVRLSDGTALSSDEYTTVIKKMPKFDNMGVTEKIEVRLTRKSNNQSVELSVPVKMSWGNTIQLRGENDKTAGAYTLHKLGDSYYISASYGENKDYQSVIHSKFGDSPYHSITVLKKGTERIDHLYANYFKEVTGNTSTKQFIEDFKGYEKVPVQLGEVVKLWHKEQGRNSYFKDEKETKYFGENDEVVYFAVTADGFVPYRLNQLKAKEMTIFTSTTDAELDQKKADMIDFQGLSGNDLKVSKISQYPDRSKAGTAQGKVLVEETIDGQTHTYEYDVIFNVLNDLNVSAKPLADIPLGTALSTNAKDYVDVASSPEAESKLTFEWVSDPISAMTVGAHQATIRVTSPTYHVSKEIKIDYKVLYGNSIVMGNDPNVTLSLLDNNGAAKLFATPGTRKNELTLQPLINIYRRSMGSLVASLQTATVFQTPENLANSWNKQLETQTVAYGDVLIASAQQKDGGILQGSETYVSRNEALVKEAEGYKDALYELTSTGYSLLHINRLTPEVQEIEQGTTEEELDKRVSEFLSTEKYNNIQVKGFSMYPDTSKVGKSTAIIIVSENLQSGGTFDYEYPVVFQIKAPTLTLKTDLKVTNLSRSEEETRVGDELLYVYTLTNDSPIGMLKAGDLSVNLPPELEAESPSDLTVPLTGLAAGQTVTHQLKVKVTEKALDQNPIVKVAGKATNESDIEQDIPEASIGVPGGTVTKIDTSEINITIPSKMNFGDDDDKIISPVYKIENNSQIPVEVKVDQFTADANLKGKDLILNLTSNDKDIVLYKDETGLQKAESLGVLDFNEIEIIEFAGSVKDQTEVSKSSSTMRFRFKPTT